MTVTLENLDTGARKVLSDSVVRFDDVYTHNFRTTMDILPEDTYRLRAEGSDGATSSAST